MVKVSVPSKQCQEEKMAEKSKQPLTGTFRTKALPSSDYFLVKNIREDLLLRDDRDVLILGVRWIYAAWHEPQMREMVLSLAETLRATDLAYWHDQPTYTRLREL